MAKTEKKVVKKEAKVVKKAVKAEKKVEKKLSEAKSRPTAGAKKVAAIVLPLPSEEKQQVITEFQVKPGDTGSPEVQIALLTSRIEKLALHLKTNNKDNHSRRGLLGIISKRRRLLNYLETKEKTRFKEISKKLGLTK